MYIAVIADNIASRKHMERLLDRTSDAIMATTGNLYIEAYGDPESMWPSIKRYDLFFVDITQDDVLKETVVNRLMELALNSQTVICQAQDETMSSWPTEHGFLSMQHPLSISSLSQIITQVHATLLENAQKKKTLEFRCEDMTHYIEADAVLYGMEDEHHVNIHLADGSVIKMLGNLFDFYRCVEVCGDFTMYQKEVVINDTHIQTKKGRLITLSNNETIKLSLFQKHIFHKINP